MSPLDATKLLDLPADASPEQLEARFNELRRKLEDKIAKAPTPGLQAKYRESLTDITTAFETLVLAADSSSLPVLQKQGAGSKEQGVSAGGPVSAPAASTNAGSPLAATSPARSAQAPTLHSKRKSGSREFAIVAVIALALLAAGGWFVMKTRADNAEQARLAAEALQQKQISEQAETTRLNALKTSLRTQVAEARVNWEAHESELQDAERRTNDLKSELRGLRDAPASKKAEISAQVTAQELFTKWLKNHLLRHPAKLARVRADEMLQAGAHDEAATVVGEITAALEKLAEDIAYRRRYFFETTARVRLQSTPAGARWILTDAYGRTQQGVTPAQVEGLPLTHVVTDGVVVAPFAGVEQRGEFTTGKITVRFIRPGWPEVIKDEIMLEDSSPLLEAEFPEGAVAVSSLPSGVPFKITQAAPDLGWTASGTTPATVTGVPVGRVRVTLSRPGFSDVSQTLDINAGQTAKTPEIDHRAQPVHIRVAESALIRVNGIAVGTQEARLPGLPPGEHTVQLEAKGYRPYRTKFSIRQNTTPLTLSYSFKQLSVENIACGTCAGAGQLNHQQKCTVCNGTARVDCSECTRGVTGYVQGDFGGGVMGNKMVMCTSCEKKGYFPCTSCTNGTYHWKSTCTTCSGDGKVSQLQLSP